MAERLAYLEAVVGADITEFRKSMRDIRNDVGILSETIQGIGGAARTMTFAFTAPMVALGTYAVQAASGFDAAMRNINSIMQLSEDKFAGLSAEVMNFAKTTRAGVVPATEALYSIFSAGITDQAKAMEVWKTSNQVAEAGLADLDQTTRAMTATMAAYQLNTDQATRVGNVWTQMVKIGVGSMGEFLTNAQKILPASANLGVSLEDMGATIAYLSQVGGGAAKAETAYSQVLTNMLKPTTAMSDAFRELGVQTGSQLIKKFGSVGAAVQALASVSDEISFAKMFSKTGLEGANILKNNVEGLSQAVKDFNNGLDTATLTAWEQQSKSFAFQWDLMKTSLEAVAIAIGTAIMPLITPLIKGFSDFLQKVTEINPELVQLGVIFVGAVAAAAPLIWLLTSLISPIGLIIGGIAALGVAFATNFDGMQDKVKNAITSIVGDLTPLKTTIDNFMADLFPKDAAPPEPQVIPVDRIIKINPPEGAPPISLYDFYDGEGFKDVVSWDDFMKLATKGGWKGGAIKAGDIVTISGIPGLAQETGTALGDGVTTWTQSRIDGWTPALKPEATTTIFDRLGVAVTNAWPALKTNLDTMWSNFTNWVTGTAIPALDGFGAKVLTAMAGWFDTSSSNFSGDTAVYDAVTGVLKTNVGAGVSDAAQSFADKFPALTAAMKTLFDNMGKWMEAEGIPTLARTIGFIGGRVAYMLGEALNSGWDFLAGGDASKAGDKLKTIVLDPLKEGVQDGFGGSGADPFARLAQKVEVAWSQMWTNIRSLANDALDPIMVKFRDFARDAKKTLADINEKLLGAQIILNPNDTKIQAAWGDAVITSDAAELSMKLEDSVNNYLAGSTLAINASEIVPQLTGQWGEKWATELAADITDPNGLMKALNIAVTTEDKTAMEVLIPITIAYQKTQNPTGSEVLNLMNATGMDAATVGGWLKDYYKDNPVMLAEIETSLNYLTVKPSADTKVDTTAVTDGKWISNAYGSGNSGTQIAGQAATELEIPIDAKVVPGDVNEATKSWADPVVANMPTAVMNAVAANSGDMDAAANSMTQPFVDAFTKAFAPEGSVTSVWGTFLTNFVTDVGTLQSTVDTKMPLVQSKMVTTMDSIGKAVNIAKDAIKDLAGQMNALNGQTVVFTIQSQAGGEAPTKGATAQNGTAQNQSNGTGAVGMQSIPFDNYIANLHRGEMVLNKGQADEYRSQAALPTQQQVQQVDNSSPTFNFYESTDFEKFMREAKRRGINLDKYRR